MRDATKKSIWALALCVLLSSCGLVPRSPAQPDDSPAEEPPATAAPPEPETPEGYSRADSLFSVNYDPSGSLNPLLGTNIYNEQLFGPLYESLFVLSPELEPIPVLCDSFETSDGMDYTLHIRPGVKFHDGSSLTADDVTYTLNIARDTEKYAQRLSDIASAETAGTLEVLVHLKRANMLLPSLLDIPIIKNGSADDPSPQGTGPYVMSGGRLDAFTSHRDYTQSSLRRIYLKEISGADLAEAFSERTVDLLDHDPTGLSKLNIHMLHETRYYSTTQLVYLGINTSAPVLRDVSVRRALSRLVDRDAIVAQSFGGAADVTPFVISRALGGWDEALGEGYAYSRQTFRRLAVIAGLDDTDQDGVLDYQGQAFSLKLIVNSESEAKTGAAQTVAGELDRMGFGVKVEALSYDDYVKALTNGDFDLYIGEVKLRGDLDVSPLFTGSLNYSRTDGDLYAGLIAAYLAAPEDARPAAAAELCVCAAEDCAVVPIAYKRRAVLTHVGVVSGAEPGQSNIFAGILGWTVTPDRH